MSRNSAVAVEGALSAHIYVKVHCIFTYLTPLCLNTRRSIPNLSPLFLHVNFLLDWLGATDNQCPVCISVAWY